jgi:hypothetical protein
MTPIRTARYSSKSKGRADNRIERFFQWAVRSWELSRSGPVSGRLDRWLGEARSSAHCQGIVHPDGIGVLKARSSSARFFLELDRGTENVDQLAAKIVDYDEAAISKHLPRVLLFCFQTEKRERSAMPALRSRRLIVATSNLDRHLADPLGPNWLPIEEERRVRLLEIPTPEEETQ